MSHALARMRLALAGLAAVGLALAASAEPPRDDAALGARLAATCAACHGTAGRGVTTTVAPLARVPREIIAARMREFRDGKRQATVMHQLAKGYTEAQVEALAAYLAAVPETKGRAP